MNVRAKKNFYMKHTAPKAVPACCNMHVYHCDHTIPACCIYQIVADRSHKDTTYLARKTQTLTPCSAFNFQATRNVRGSPRARPSISLASWVTTLSSSTCFSAPDVRNIACTCSCKTPFQFPTKEDAPSEGVVEAAAAALLAGGIKDDMIPGVQN